MIFTDRYQELSYAKKAVVYGGKRLNTEAAGTDLSWSQSHGRRYFNSFYRKNTGENPRNYLTDIRMKGAVKLLGITDDKANGAAKAVGYKNVRRINEDFKGK